MWVLSAYIGKNKREPFTEAVDVTGPGLNVQNALPSQVSREGTVSQDSEPANKYSIKEAEENATDKAILRENEHLKKMVASLKEEMKLTKSVQVKRADVEKLASRFLEEYQSSVDESGITAGLLKRIESAFKRTCRIRGVRQAEPASLPSPSSARRPSPDTSCQNAKRPFVPLQSPRNRPPPRYALPKHKASAFYQSISSRAGGPPRSPLTRRVCQAAPLLFRLRPLHGGLHPIRPAKTQSVRFLSGCTRQSRRPAKNPLTRRVCQAALLLFRLRPLHSGLHPIRPAKTQSPQKKARPIPAVRGGDWAHLPLKALKRPAGPRGFTALQNPCTGCAGQWRALAPGPSGNPCRR